MLKQKLQNAKLSNGNTREQLLARLPVPGPGRKKVTKEERLIRRYSKQAIVNYLQKQGLGASERIVKISKKAVDKVALAANQDILNRIGVGVEKNNIGVAVQVNIGEDKNEFA